MHAHRAGTLDGWVCRSRLPHKPIVGFCTRNVGRRAFAPARKATHERAIPSALLRVCSLIQVYTVLWGCKIFVVAPPSPKNLKLLQQIGNAGETAEAEKMFVRQFEGAMHLVLNPGQVRSTLPSYALLPFAKPYQCVAAAKSLGLCAHARTLTRPCTRSHTHTRTVALDSSCTGFRTFTRLQFCPHTL
eukprot:4797440-Pleurochrysis_carterae.AAC.1